jgi:hypothetical protein
LHKIRSTEFKHCLQRGHIMRSVKTLIAFTAIASSILVVSWVGLALLGF